MMAVNGDEIPEAGPSSRPLHHRHSDSGLRRRRLTNDSDSDMGSKPIELMKGTADDAVLVSVIPDCLMYVAHVIA